jgi:hypothetical protein
MPSTRLASIPTKTVELVEDVEAPQKTIRKRKKKVE